MSCILVSLNPLRSSNLTRPAAYFVKLPNTPVAYFCGHYQPESRMNTVPIVIFEVVAIVSSGVVKPCSPVDRSAGMAKERTCTVSVFRVEG
jgi:hypothetical protein